MNKAVFLDRDGTLAVDVRYCKDAKDFQVFAETAGAIKMLNEHGFKVIVVTNQSGIGMGYVTHEAVKNVHAKLRAELQKAYAKVDGIYYCPHHPKLGCDCRKPKTRMAKQAAKDHKIDFKKSWMVGDANSDIEFGKALGCKTILVRGIADGAEPDYVVKDLMEAVEVICNKLV